MKIGVITYWYSTENYGQILQCFALQRFLRDMGHSVFLIKYRPRSYTIPHMRFRDFAFSVLKLLYLFNKDNLRMSLRFRQMSSRSTDGGTYRHFDKFINKYIMSTDCEYDQHSLYDCPPEADIYITGSDQVWRMPDSCYFLDFVPKEKGRVAYAPSFGADRLPWIFKRIIKKYLSKFDIVTVREKTGINICSYVGRDDAKLVPDPVFLLNADVYDKLIPSDKSVGSDYVFVYLLGNKIDLEVSQIDVWAQRHNLRVKYVASCGADMCKSLTPSIEEWLALIRNAKYVITNSFHGMAFSILFNRQFTVIPLSDEFSRMNDRIYTVTENLGISSRVYNGNLDSITDIIDYIRINKLLAEQRNDIRQMFETYFV